MADTEHLLGHVKDATHFEVPRVFQPDGRLEINQPFVREESLIPVSEARDRILEPFDLRITKFMVLEVVAAVIVAVVFIRLASLIANGDRPRGRFVNLFEAMLVYLRDEVARAAVGKHDGDKYVPFLWTLFFFVLTCNLLGLVPWLGTATGALATTLALALITFAVVVGSGMRKLGVAGYWLSLVPHMDLPGPVGIVLKPIIFVIELMGLLIKHFILAVRLLANMFAGHLVLAVILGFIIETYASPLWYGVAPASVFGAVALSLLELLVAFIQAYIFTFLAALFVGMALHPH